jgi:hypothetical protein
MKPRHRVVACLLSRHGAWHVKMRGQRVGGSPRLRSSAFRSGRAGPGRDRHRPRRAVAETAGSRGPHRQHAAADRRDRAPRQRSGLGSRPARRGEGSPCPLPGRTPPSWTSRPAPTPTSATGAAAGTATTSSSDRRSVSVGRTRVRVGGGCVPCGCAMSVDGEEPVHRVRVRFSWPRCGFEICGGEVRPG